MCIYFLNKFKIKFQLSEIAKLNLIYSYWQEPTEIRKEVDIMIYLHTNSRISMKLWAIIRYSIDSKFVRTVQELINNTISQNQSQNFDFNSYHALEKKPR